MTNQPIYVAVACLDGKPMTVATEPSTHCSGLRSACDYMDEHLTQLPGVEHRIFRLVPIEEEECPYESEAESTDVGGATSDSLPA